MDIDTFQQFLLLIIVLAYVASYFYTKPFVNKRINKLEMMELLNKYNRSKDEEFEIFK